MRPDHPRNSARRDAIATPYRSYMPEFELQALSFGAGRAKRTEDLSIDTDIVSRMASGDESAIGALFDRWVDAVNALVRQIVTNVEDADDVVASVFWQATRCRSK